MKILKILILLSFCMLIVISYGQKKYNEAPMLAELVKQGKLPPVEQRLPKNPLVIKPFEEIGKYGGTWRRAWLGISDRWGVMKICFECARLVSFSPDGKKIQPNLVARWTISPDSKVYTFYLREGVKWSDGKPFTVDDIIFWFEDIICNKDLTPSFPTVLSARGEPPKFEKINDYTFKITFKYPNSLLLYVMASEGNYPFYAPKHYLMQFHPRYTPMEVLEKMAKDAGFQKWYQLFDFKRNPIQNPELPVLAPWKVISKSPQDPIFVMERNPYYYKVDPAGNQLPYIDKVVHYLVNDAQMAVMKAIAGEIDMQIRHMGDYTLLMENRERGNYRVIRWKGTGGASTAIYLNQNCKDPVKRKLFENVKFRQALSLAINREEINKINYQGLATPMQAAIPKGLPYYDPAWEKAYAQYDPARANKLLDEIGLSKRDADGFRLGPDGKPLQLIIESFYNPADLELIKKYWENVGLRTFVKIIERSLYTTKCQSGDIEIGAFVMDRCANILATPGRILGTTFDGPWAPLYGLWYATGGKSGEEPKGDIKKLYELWDKIIETSSTVERDKLVRQIIALHRKNLWIIGTVGGGVVIGIAKNNFRNVPEDLIWDDTLRSPANAYPEQFFFK